MYRFKKEIIALMQGETIQFKFRDKWIDASEIILYSDKAGEDCWLSDKETEVRIKPKPVSHLARLEQNAAGGVKLSLAQEPNIRLTYNAEGKLIKAEVLENLQDAK